MTDGTNGGYDDYDDDDKQSHANVALLIVRRMKHTHKDDV